MRTVFALTFAATMASQTQEMKWIMKRAQQTCVLKTYAWPKGLRLKLI